MKGQLMGYAVIVLSCMLAVPAAGQGGDQVLRTYEQALAGNPDDLSIRYNLASAYYERGLYSRAVEQYREIAKLATDDMAPHYNIGLIYYHQREYAKALDAFNRAHLLAKRDDNVLYVMGMCHLALENYGQAITAMDMAVKLNPENVDARINLANSFANSSRYNEAVTLYRAILQQVGRDEFVRKNFGSALYNAGLEHFLNEEYDAALRYLRESFTYMQERRKAYLLAANSEFNLERYTAAIPLYRIVIEEDENSVDAHYYLAYSYLMVDSLILAQREFERVLRINPAHSKALKFKAELLDENFSRTVEKVILAYQRQEYVTAWMHLRDAEELVPGHENVLKYRGLLQDKIDKVIQDAAATGDRQFMAGDHTGCLAAYRKALRLDPMQFQVQVRLDSAEAILEGRYAPVMDKADAAMLEERYYDAVTGYEAVATVLPVYRSVNKRLREARGLLQRETSLLAAAAAGYSEAKDLQRAVTEYDRLKKVNPGFSDTSKAERAVRETLARQMDEKQARVGALLTKGRADFEAGRFWEARNGFAALLKTDPGHSEAQELCDRAEQGISRQVTATLDAGLKSIRAQKFMTANGHFKKVLKLDPKNRDAARYGRICRSILLAREAGSYAGQKKFVAAIAAYRRAQELDRDNQMARDGMARVIAARDTEVARLLASGDDHAAARRYREAEKTYKTILEAVSPGNAEAQDRLKRLGRQRSGENNRANVDALYSNGVGHYTRGEYQLAVAEWQKVLEIDPDHEKARRNITNARRKLDFMKK